MTWGSWRGGNELVDVCELFGEGVGDIASHLLHRDAADDGELGLDRLSLPTQGPDQTVLDHVGQVHQLRGLHQVALVQEDQDLNKTTQQ